MWLLWCFVLAGRRPAQISCLTSFFRRMLRIWTRLLTIVPELSWSWASNRKTGAIEETCETQPAACWWRGPCDLNSISTIWLYNSAFFNVPHDRFNVTIFLWKCWGQHLQSRCDRVGMSSRRRMQSKPDSNESRAPQHLLTMHLFKYQQTFHSHCVEKTWLFYNLFDLLSRFATHHQVIHIWISGTSGRCNKRTKN